MSNQFEERLNECLEALSSGERTLEQCLSMYPEDAARLEPMLRTAVLLADALAAKPRKEFAESARERFLKMSEPRLHESLSFEPRPSFVMAARSRFLAVAQKMMGERKPSRWSRWEPAFRVAQFASAACAVLFLGFGTFAVSTSANALPGDWQYPIKRKVEDVRYTLAFGEGARQELKIDFTKERLTEVEKLAEKGPVDEGPLKDLADQTNSLVGVLDNPQQVNLEDAQEMLDLAQQQRDVLEAVAPNVNPAAADELKQANSVSSEVSRKAAKVITVLAEPTPEPTETPAAGATSTPEESTPTAAATETPEETPTAVAGTPAPTTGPATPAVTPIPDTLIITPIQDSNDAGIAWDLAVIERFSVEVPDPSSGWQFMGLTVGPGETTEAPYLLRFANSDATAIVVINPRNGDVYWEQYFEDDDVFHEFIARASSLGWQATAEDLEAFHEENADIVAHVVNSIRIVPEPTPTPEPTPEATAASPDVIIDGAAP